MRPSISIFALMLLIFANVLFCQDVEFARSTLGVTFPAAVIAADSWWRYDPALSGGAVATNSTYRQRIADVNARLIAAGVDSCPTSCMWNPHSDGGCNETSRCGVDYVHPPTPSRPQQPSSSSLNRLTDTSALHESSTHHRVIIEGSHRSASNPQPSHPSHTATRASINDVHNGTTGTKQFISTSTTIRDVDGTQPRLNAAFYNIFASMIDWTPAQWEEDLG